MPSHYLIIVSRICAAIAYICIAHVTMNRVLRSELADGVPMEMFATA